MARRTLHRHVLVSALVLGLLASLAITLGHQGAVGSEPTVADQRAVLGEPVAARNPFPRGIVVVGDSITARYDDEPGSRHQGWWSFVARHYDTPVRTYAQSGSGYLRPGMGCTGDTFVQRRAAFRGPAPSVFIVEGGRNDWASCAEGRLVPSSDAAVQQAVTRYLRLVKRQMPESTRILVLGPPWGPTEPWQQRRVTSIVHAAALREGLEYVPTRGALDRHGRTIDGVHPTLSGSLALADVVVGALDQPAPGSTGLAPVERESTARAATDTTP
ncbi:MULTISPECIES: SGNH/GDSL hydrolase family protein [unclassified Aeromicrobium]|jgi:lysophospholipase L1-like esterase|uniref:SGNH/GDSL hydrolase family protein n=1 Tax=unclassified Aeromicrobium TaxID=2633570 RepID=UPI000A82B5F2|nr:MULTISPECIES: SGNH/GDSL hydrolase family protein [unclassified Aeromicrobium]